MTSLQRFRALLPFMMDIYSKPTSAERTASLQEALLSLSTLMNPVTADQWITLRQDADRVLRLWGVKESDPAASEMATQLLSMIDGFTIESSGPEDVTLVIEEKGAPPEPQPPVQLPPVELLPNRPVYNPFIPGTVIPLTSTPINNLPTAVTESVTLPAVDLPAVDFEDEQDEQDVCPTEVKVVVIRESTGDEDAVTSSEVENLNDEDIPEPVDQEEEPSGCLAAASLEEDEEEEAPFEDVEEEGEEEGGEGVEVTKIFHKSRAYWLGSDQKIYACAEDDEIGEEIGDYDPITKKPLFY
jgi:hypothetical protein